MKGRRLFKMPWRAAFGPRALGCRPLDLGHLNLKRIYYQTQTPFNDLES